MISSNPPLSTSYPSQYTYFTLKPGIYLYRYDFSQKLYLGETLGGNLNFIWDTPESHVFHSVTLVIHEFLSHSHLINLFFWYEILGIYAV